MFTARYSIRLAEAVRFELTNGCPLPVFKTGAIDHSATLPEVGEYSIPPAPLPRAALRIRRVATAHARSNSAIDSTCEVCGNMFAMPAPRRR